MKRWILIGVRLFLAFACAMAGWAKLSGNPRQLLGRPDGAFRLGHLIEDVTATFVVNGASVAERETTTSAVEQSGPQSAFQVHYVLADHGHRHIQHFRRAGETA